jgi:hypothetical protein
MTPRQTAASCQKQNRHNFYPNLSCLLSHEHWTVVHRETLVYALRPEPSFDEEVVEVEEESH